MEKTPSPTQPVSSYNGAPCADGAPCAPCRDCGKCRESLRYERSFAVLTAFSPAPSAASGTKRNHERGYGIAIDIGTTTVALVLVNMLTGSIEGTVSLLNLQREFGADVINRIDRANKGFLTTLTTRIRKQLALGIGELLRTSSAASSVASSAAYYAAYYAPLLNRIVIAGNTTMLHLFWGHSCATLGVYPFTPVCIDFEEQPAGSVFAAYYDSCLPCALPPECKVITLPGISTYVGADIVSGIYFTDMCALRAKKETALLLDIGTNGEMALCHRGKITCAATAAGPAFEGGNISCGTGSIPGAIHKVGYDNNHFTFETIGGETPTGICGSGLIELLYHCRAHDIIGPTGALSPPGALSPRYSDKKISIARARDGAEIYLTQQDIRELQLAKSAIRSGIDTLLHAQGLSAEDVTTLYIAGGFGSSLDALSCAAIGLIPAALRDKVKTCGNSALGGCVKYIVEDGARAHIERIIATAREVQLGGDPFFNERFMENIEFECS